MPLTAKGRKILSAMKEEYGSEKGERVFYASKNAGRISGVDARSPVLDTVLMRLRRRRSKDTVLIPRSRISDQTYTPQVTSGAANAGAVRPAATPNVSTSAQYTPSSFGSTPTLNALPASLDPKQTGGFTANKPASHGVPSMHPGVTSSRDVLGFRRIPQRAAMGTDESSCTARESPPARPQGKESKVLGNVVSGADELPKSVDVPPSNQRNDPYRSNDDEGCRAKSAPGKMPDGKKSDALGWVISGDKRVFFKGVANDLMKRGFSIGDAFSHALRMTRDKYGAQEMAETVNKQIFGGDPRTAPPKLPSKDATYPVENIRGTKSFLRKPPTQIATRPPTTKHTSAAERTGHQVGMIRKAAANPMAYASLGNLGPNPNAVARYKERKARGEVDAASGVGDAGSQYRHPYSGSLKSGDSRPF